MEAEVQRIDRRLQEWTLQAARNKDAREAKHAVHRAEARRERRGSKPNTSKPKPGSKRSRPRWPRCASKREGLQQEAAQVTAELAGLEERRRGAEAAFQRIDRLHADLERRVLAIEQQRAAAEAEREQRIRESDTLAERQKELDRACAPKPSRRRRRSPLKRRRCASSWPTLETQLKTRPRRHSTSCATIAPTAASELRQAALRSRAS